LSAPNGVRLATPEDAPRIVESLIAAFERDPFVAWVAGETRLAARRLYFEHALHRLTMPHGNVWVAGDSAEGAALWAPSHAWQLGWLAQLALLPRVVRVVGLRRLGLIMRGVELVEGHRPKGRFNLLVLLGTRPEARGTGHASALLEAGLARCRREGVDALLDTSNADNVRFYERRGFEVIRRVDLPEGPPCWSMRYAAPAQLSHA
jgi:ribosomal protein S18 acetylase RimI-like enzyme